MAEVVKLIKGHDNFDSGKVAEAILEAKDLIGGVKKTAIKKLKKLCK